MKKNIHPLYQRTAFLDTTIQKEFVINSSLTAESEITIDDKKLPLVKVSTSAYSHPFYTGKYGIVQAKGRMEKFLKKYKKK